MTEQKYDPETMRRLTAVRAQQNMHTLLHTGLSEALGVDLGGLPPMHLFPARHDEKEPELDPAQWREIRVNNDRGYTRWDKDPEGRVLVHLGTYDGPSIWCHERHIHAAG